MNQNECAKAVADPIQAIGGKYMMDPATFAAAPEVGLEPGIGFYALGRFGHLGAMSADEAAELMFFAEPATFAASWDETLPKADPDKVADRFLQACAEWGRQNLTPEKAEESWLQTFADLGEKAIESASGSSGGTDARLFLELRKKDRPADLPGRVSFAGHLLRELRLAHHVAAVKQEGMDALTAILAGPGGEANAKMFQFPEPFPEITDEMRQQRQQAEDTTDSFSAMDFAALSDQERGDFAAAAASIFKALD